MIVESRGATTLRARHRCEFGHTPQGDPVLYASSVAAIDATLSALVRVDVAWDDRHRPVAISWQRCNGLLCHGGDWHQVYAFAASYPGAPAWWTAAVQAYEHEIGYCRWPCPLCLASEGK